MHEVEALTNRFVEQLAPLKVYLFGSYAENQFKSDSDYDFYIVVADGAPDLPALTARAYRAIRNEKKRPVDILASTHSRFEARKALPGVEHEVWRKGVLLYEA